jgi:hypothetical protein
MDATFLRALVSACDKGPGGVPALPERSTLARRLEGSAFRETILDAYDACPGGPNEFSQSAGLVCVDDPVAPSRSRSKRARPGGSSYAQLDRVCARAKADLSNASLRQFKVQMEDGKFEATRRRLGQERKPPVKFDAFQYEEALRSLQNLQGG